MKAVVIHAPHDVRLDDWAEEAPQAGEVQVRIGNGGICGSDLHYYHHGGFGTVRIPAPDGAGARDRRHRHRGRRQCHPGDAG